MLSKVKTAEAAYDECHARTLKKDYEEAIECFELLKSRFNGTQIAFEADLEIADNYFRKKDYLLAADTYLAFVKLHPSHEKTGYAYYRIGLSYLKESPKAPDRDQQYLDDAIRYLETATSMTQGSLNEVAREKWKEARTRIAKRHFYVGRFYHKTGEYQSAIPRFTEIVTHYTDLGLDEKALFLLGDSYNHLAKKEEALEVLAVFEQHFPMSPYRKKLAKIIGVQ